MTFLDHKLIIKKVVETPLGFYYELGCLCCTIPYYFGLTISEIDLKSHEGVDLEVVSQRKNEEENYGKL